MRRNLVDPYSEASMRTSALLLKTPQRWHARRMLALALATAPLLLLAGTAEAVTSCVPALAAAAPGSTPPAPRGLPATGLDVILPMLAVTVLVVSAVLVRRRRAGSALLLVACMLVGSTAVSGPPAEAAECPAPASLPYLVGVADTDITPTGEVNLGGNGLGDGSVLPDEVVGRGSTGGPEGEQIKVRALVVDDGSTAVALATIETQGVFVSYTNGPYGTKDVAALVAAQVPALPAQNQLIASNHTHSGPDTIGAWGGVPNEYFAYIRDQAVAAIVNAYAARRPATLVAGGSEAPDLIYNQSCPEALNQSEEPTYNGPDVCPTEGKDSRMRVLQARGADGRPFATYMAYAAHATAGGADGVHGDWPAFLSEAMAERYGGFGMAMSGANGRTQPCRPRCSFTDPAQPGYELEDRRAAYTRMYLNHVEDAVDSATPVSGPVRAAQTLIREAITGPAVLALFEGGSRIGAPLLRDRNPPYLSGSVVGTVTSALRIGGVLITGTPGEPYPAIAAGIAAAVEGEQEHITLALANDQLGYLIAPASIYPIIAAQVAVNDNAIFNVSPTIGDHVMCSDIGLSLSLGFAGASPPGCAPYAAADAAGEVFGQVPLPGLPPL